MSDVPFDPAPFRRDTILRRLLEAARTGADGDPDAGLPDEERTVREETRRLIAEALPEDCTVEQEDAIIRACWERARRIERRKRKRHAAGREWGE